MLVSPATSYDEVPFDSLSYPESHPDRLATVATLLGLKPPPVDRCRVLDLGCAGGGNLIPLATTLPGSSFVGVEISPRQVAQGQKVIADLGLTNIELKLASIDDLRSDFGPFDYIIAHGVYSWVPPAVQDKLLTVYKQCLAPDGVGYVSYNAFPGWHVRGMIREMMAYHIRSEDQAPERARKARALLDFVCAWSEPRDSAYARVVKSERDMLANQGDFYLLHDHLEENNRPVYFSEFAERAGAKGLRYLGESDLWIMLPGNFEPAVEEVLRALAGDNLRLEQYMDFLRNRMFRETLLCHDSDHPSHSFRPEQIAALHVASPIKRVEEQPGGGMKFEGLRGTTLICREPLTQAALSHLSEVWPEAVPFGELLEKAKPGATAKDVLFLQQYLLKMYTTAGASLLELHVYPPRLVRRINARPMASPLARYQAENGHKATNLRHQTLLLDEVQRQILVRLDGSHDRTDLSRATAEPDTVVDEQLDRLARNAFLVA